MIFDNFYTQINYHYLRNWKSYGILGFKIFSHVSNGYHIIWPFLTILEHFWPFWTVPDRSGPCNSSSVVKTCVKCQRRKFIIISINFDSRNPFFQPQYHIFDYIWPFFGPFIHILDSSGPFWPYNVKIDEIDWKCKYSIILMNFDEMILEVI